MPSTAVGVRARQRLATRARVFDAAVAEIGRSGLAGADIGAIAAAAEVSRGTFYFHFPTKEHVLVELERAEEVRIVAELGDHPAVAAGLDPMLTELVRHVVAAEDRLGPVLFRDMLGLHFSPTRPSVDLLAEHPLAEFLVAAIGETDTLIFLTGLFALLTVADGEPDGRASLLERYVSTIIHGMEPR